MSTSKTLWITCGAFFSFFLLGFVDNMRGGTISGMLAETGFSYSAGGSIVFTQYLGFVVAALLSGIISDRFGKRTVMFMAGGLLLVGMYGYAAVQTKLMFQATFFLVGMGCGSLELGGCNTITAIHGANSGKFMNLLTCCHGVGSTISPLFVGLLLSQGLSWRFSYQLGLVVVAAFLGYFLFVKYPADEAQAREKPARFREVARQTLSGELRYLNLLFLAYVGVEIGLATWMAEFIAVEKGVQGFWPAASLSLYFGAVMAGRFIGSFIVDRIGHLNVLLFCGIGGVATMTLGIFGPSRLFLLLPLTGIFHSVIFPTATAVASGLLTRNRGTILGILFCSGGLGGMLVPWLIGIGCDRFGMKGGMCVGLVSGVVVVVAVVGVIRIRHDAGRVATEPC